MNSCALHVADNGPASVSYAWMWYQFPYGVLGVALSTALFTEMSDCLSRRDKKGFVFHLNAGLRTTWLLIIPMAIILIVCSEELIGLYAAGRFTANDIAPIAPRQHSLIFGNEARGLDASFASVGQSVLIPQSREIDSLNLSVAASIAMYTFSNSRKASL